MTNRNKHLQSKKAVIKGLSQNMGFAAYGHGHRQQDCGSEAIAPTFVSRYEGWDVVELETKGCCVAKRQLPGSDAVIECRLDRHPSITYAGSWPRPISDPPRIVLTGMCVYSDCWRARLEPAAPGQPAPRPLVIGLKLDRAKLKHYISRGRKVQKIEIPRQLCYYQQVLLDWQRQTLAEWNSVEEVYYHIPIAIYHTYIQELEIALGQEQPELHLQLESYGTLLRDRVKRTLEPLAASLHFVDPHLDPEGRPLTPEAADRWLYLEAWDREDVVGLEDLAQLTIPASIAKERGGLIPCQVGLLDLPHPLSTCGGRCCDPLSVSLENCL